MGLCNQIHDNIPKRWTVKDDKYKLTRNQIDIIKVFDRSIRFDISGIIEEWRITEMICEAMDLVKESEALLKQARPRETT